MVTHVASRCLFSRSDVALTLFATGLFRSNWPTDPQSLIYISQLARIAEKFLRILHHYHVTDQDITKHTPFIVHSRR